LSLAFHLFTHRGKTQQLSTKANDTTHSQYTIFNQVFLEIRRHDFVFISKFKGLKSAFGSTDPHCQTTMIKAANG